LREGRLRAIAISGPGRSELAPDVPTLAEGGLTGLSLTVWYGIAGPRGLPPEVVRLTAAALQDALARPDVAQRLSAQGLTPRFMPPEVFDPFMTAERTRWGDAARAANVTVD
jgi:tripartite-type tricarboxylate transporter receptor subunit TctC